MQRVLWVCMALVLAAWGSNECGRSSGVRDAQQAPPAAKEYVFALPNARDTLDAPNQDGRAVVTKGRRSARIILIRRGSGVRQLPDLGGKRVFHQAIEAFLQRFNRTVHPLMGESQ